jgi:hypothetical protein
MRSGSIAMIALLVAAVLSAGVTAQTMPLPASPPEKSAPCHRHHKPSQVPTSHQCCQNGQALVIVKSVREESPATSALTSRDTFAGSAPIRTLCNLRPDQILSGCPPNLSPLRI